MQRQIVNSDFFKAIRNGDIAHVASELAKLNKNNNNDINNFYYSYQTDAMIPLPPLMAAIVSEHDEMVETIFSFLLSTRLYQTKELDFNISLNQAQKTALMMAASLGHSDTVELFITSGAFELSITDARGRTAADYAVAAGHVYIANRLTQEARLKVSARNARFTHFALCIQGNYGDQKRMNAQENQSMLALNKAMGNGNS